MADEDLVCCGTKEIVAMEGNLVMAEGIFGRCPACYYNMLKSICAMACAPDQSRFLTPNIVTKEVDGGGEDDGDDDTTKRNVTYVESIRFKIDESYINATYNSCSRVIMPATGAIAMDMACGAFYNSRTCTPKRYVNLDHDTLIDIDIDTE